MKLWSLGGHCSENQESFLRKASKGRRGSFAETKKRLVVPVSPKSHKGHFSRKPRRACLRKAKKARFSESEIKVLWNKSLIKCLQTYLSTGAAPLPIPCWWRFACSPYLHHLIWRCGTMTYVSNNKLTDRRGRHIAIIKRPPR